MTDAQREIISLLQQIKAGGGGGGAVDWGAITGTLSNQTDLQTALDDIIASIPGYLVYIALLTQTGTDDPVATVLQNTLGGTVVWTRDDMGRYLGTLAGAFTVNKTFCSITHSLPADPVADGLILTAYSNATGNTVRVESYRIDGILKDMINSAVVGASIEIRVFP